MNGTRERPVLQSHGVTNSFGVGGDVEEKKNHGVSLYDVVKLSACAVGGVVFGFAAEKGRGR